MLRIPGILMLFFVILNCASPDRQATPGLLKSSGKQLARIEFPEDSVSTIEFSYNDAGDIASIYNSTDTAIYRYAGDSIFLDWTDGQGKVVATQHFATSPEGRVISNDVRDPEGMLFASSTYAYNAKGQLVKQIRHNLRTQDSFALNFNYMDDNLMKILISRNGKETDSFGYTYDTARLNKFQFDVDNISNDYFSNGRIGIVNKNLVTMSYRMETTGDTTAVRTHTYQLDADGYVLMRTDADTQYGYFTQRKYIYADPKE